jgi:hypothetical protein
MRSLLLALHLVQDVAWVMQLQHAGSNMFSNLLNTTAREGKVRGGVIEALDDPEVSAVAEPKHYLTASGCGRQRLQYCPDGLTP